MSQILLMIKNFAVIFYAISFFALLLGIRRILRALGELSIAQFRLERENAEQSGGRGITQAVLSLQFMGLIFLLSTTTYQAISQQNPSDQPMIETINEFGTSVPVDNNGQLLIPTQASDGVVLLRTQPPSPTFAGTRLPADDPVGCLADQANIVIPNNGQVVFEAQPIIGVANVQNFGYYRFEIRNVSTGESSFGVIGGAASDYTVPVPEQGPLGSIIPQNFAIGEHQFRLAVFDTGGNIVATCEITVYISEPIPTPTPLTANVPSN